MTKIYKMKTRLALAVVSLMIGFGAIAQVDVVATGGTPSASYTTLGAAFAAINAGTHTGNIGIGISASTTETGPCVLNSNGAGSASYTAIGIVPTVDGVSISGPTTTGRGLIELNGADNITIDGDNPNTGGINRNLTLTNTAATTVTFTSVIRVAAGTAAPYLDNNSLTIKNLVLLGSAFNCNSAALTSTSSGGQNTSFGVVVSPLGGITPSPITNATTPINTSATVNAFVLDNCSINQCGRGVAFLGNSATSSDLLTITNNTIGGAGALGTYPFTTPTNTVYTQGIFATGANAVTITGNTIQNIISYVSTLMNGIVLNSGIGAGAINISNNTITAVTNNGTSNGSAGITINSAGSGSTINISGNTVSNIQDNTSTSQAGIQIGTSSAASATISNNKVSTVWARSTGGYAARGILLGSGNNITVKNNMIWDINMCPNNSATTTTFGARGINITSGTGHKIYNNSIFLSGPVISSTNTDITVCLGITSASLTGIDVRNNIFSNTMTGGSATTPHVCLQLPSGATSAMNLMLNNNAYYSGTTAGQSGIIITTAPTLYTAANFIAGAITPATNSRSYTSTLSVAGTNDNASYASTNAAPFVSATDLHLNLASSELANVEQKGDPSVTVTTDIDGDARPNPPTTNPDMGADEVIVANCVSANGGTISPATQTACVGLTAIMSSTGVTTGTGITYQWMVSTTSGGPYSNVTGGSGATTPSYTTGALTAGTFYYVLQITCSFGPLTGLSNELTVTVNPNPTVGVTPTTGTFCTPGGTPVALTASGATTYSWLPAAGLSATTGTNVNASPATAATYTVTGTTAGCTGTATTVISIAATPVVTATATPPAVCSGGNSQLLATGVIPVTSYAVTSIPYAPTTGTGTQAVTGDDAVSGAITLPFTFNYFGTAYTQAFVYTNGFIQLGASSGSTTTYAKDLTTTGTPNTVISGVWSDLNSTAGQITTYTTGVTPNRVFTVYYNNVAFYSSATTYTGNTNFQILLYEGSNIVEVHVGAATGVSTTTSNKTLGIENSTGAFNAFPAGHNAANWSAATPEAWRFTPNTGTYTYVWTPATFLSSATIANPMATAITATTTYTATLTESSGCSATATTTITAGSPLTSTSSVTPGTICAGGTVNFTSTPSGGGAPYTYAWSGPGSFTSTAQNPTLVTTSSSSGTYTITVTDNCAATSTTTVALTVNPLPAVSVTPSSASYCNPGTPVSLGASGAVSYTWSPAAGLSATTGTSVNASPIVTTVYTVTGTDGNGCTNTSSATISSNPTVTGDTAIATPPAICAGGTTNLTASANPYDVTLLVEDFNSGAPAWTRTNNSTGGTPANAAWINRPDGFVYGTGTAYHSNDNTQFVQTNSDSQGSGSTTNTLLTSPVFSTSGYTGVKVKFYQYYRDIGDAGDSAVVEASTDGVSWTIAGAYTATSGSENAFAAATVTLPPAFDNQTAVYVRFRFVATWDWYWSIDNVNITGGSTAFTYSWTSTPAGFTSTAQNPTGVMPPANTTYSVVITNPGGCSATASATVAVGSPLISTSNITPSNTVCTGTDVTLNSAPSGGGAPYTYAWSGPGGYTSTIQNPVITGAVVANSGTYTITVTDNCGSNSVSTVTLTVNPLPVVTVTPTTGLICNPGGSAVTLTASGAGAGTYAWTPTSGLSAATGSSTSANPTASTTYTVTGTDVNGCMNTATAAISVNNTPALVVTATPNPVCSGSNTQLLATATLPPTSYAVTSIPYAPIPTPGSGVTTLCSGGVDIAGTSAGNLDDGTWANQTIPFNFGYFGINYTSFAVGTNGFITMGPGASSTDQGYGNAFPSTSAADASIGPIYADLDFRTTGTIEYFTTGTTPNQIMVINYTNGNFYSGSGSLTTQILLYESTNVIEVHTTNSTGDNAAVEGIQDQTGTNAYVVPGRNAVNWSVSTPDAYRFGPPSGTFTYTWSPGTFLSSTSINNPMANAITASTTYTVTATASSGCAATDSVAVTVNPLPTVTATASASPICAGASETLTGGGSATTYTWSGGVSDTTAFAAMTTTTYTVTGTDVNGCSDTASVTVVVNPLPVVTATASANPICMNSSETLTGGGTATTYSWTGGVTNAAAFTATTSNTYTVTGTDVNGCMDTASIMITVNPLPAVTATSSMPVVCAGTSDTLMGGGTATSFTWTGGVINATGFIPASTLTYTVTGTDMNGCMDTASTTITVNPLPIVTASASFTAVCTGASDTLMGGGATSYSWTGGVTDAAGFVPASTNTYTVTGTDMNGCMNTASILITVNPLPVVNLGMDTVQCGGGVLLDAGNPGSMYAWSDLSSGQTTIASTTGNYSVTVTDVNSCSASDTVMVTINTLPVVNLGPDVTQCGGGDTLDAGNPGLNYLWSNSTTAQTLPVFITGTYGVTVTDPATGCSGSDVINITINAVPVVNLGSDSTQCGGTITLAAAGTGSSYLWNDASTGATLLVTSSGTYSVTVGNGTGCTASDAVSIVIHPLPLVGFTAPSSPICLQAPAIALTGTPSGGTFTGTGVVTGPMFDPSVSGVGTFPIMYSITDSNSCSNSVSHTIIVHDCNGVEENTFSQDINIYPNPTSGTFNIEILNANFSSLMISIVDIQGKEVYTVSDKNISNDYIKSIDLENFAKGIYYIKFSTDTNVKIKKLIIQ